MKNMLLLLCCSAVIFSFVYKNKTTKANEPVVTNGAMPSVTKDAKGIIYMVFAKGDKLEYVSSADKGVSFSKPVLVDTIKDFFAVAGRGPHITATAQGLCILTLNKAGNIYAYTKEGNGKWIKNGQVNDVDDVAKEGFLSVSSNGDSLYAVWLDLRITGKNKIVGTLSADAGKTWSKNKIIYESPEGSVCECCHVSVVFAVNGINVMFRNNLNGNRNLYLIQSHDGGNNFGEAVKLGEGNWKLNGCPMDGGGIAVHKNGSIQTVWRRIDTIYSCKPGAHEEMIGKGKNCTMEKMNEENAYAWIENGVIVCLLPSGKKVMVAEGSFPVLKTINENQLLCVWQNNNNIYRKIIDL